MNGGLERWKWRGWLVPLEGPAQLKQGRFLKRAADQLKADRKLAAGEAAGSCQYNITFNCAVFAGTVIVCGCTEPLVLLPVK